MVLWGTPVGPYAHYTYKTLWKTGITSIMNEWGAHANITCVRFPVGDFRGQFRGRRTR